MAPSTGRDSTKGGCPRIFARVRIIAARRRDIATTTARDARAPTARGREFRPRATTASIRAKDARDDAKDARRDVG